jgi:hypothetical protein
MRVLGKGYVSEWMNLFVCVFREVSAEEVQDDRKNQKKLGTSLEIPAPK